ncbi:MAG TPA: hypothetical protein VHO29_12325 [Marmoricola sp.]|nr:hypothetical protein [Marmoricola sp.]
MPGSEFHDAPPPEVPEEFAAAYREAYLRALQSGDVPQDQPGPHEHPAQHDQPAAGGVPDELTARLPVGDVEPPADRRSPFERWRASRWFLVSVVTAAAAVLVAGAYAVGSTVAGGGRHQDAGTAVQQSSRATHATRSPSKATPTKASKAHVPNAWTGPVQPVSIDAIAADCTAPPAKDAAGHTVDYVPQNATDGEAQTAWRCTGSAIGQKLTLRLGAQTDIAQVGLIAGYAKTDPASGADRYAENNRITRVRWTLGDGVSVVQRLDPESSSRAMQVLRVPRTTTDTVTLEILAVKRGPRDTTAISEISLSAAR